MKAGIDFIILTFFLAVLAFAQQMPPVITAQRVHSSIRFDGDLEEADWQTAQPAADFRQREPRNGEDATEKTEIRILYDRDNLYIGVLCFDSQPDKIIANSLVRDSDLDGDDQVTIVIDTYLDHRTGFVFATNPRGARLDAFQYAPERDPNVNWNGVWDVRAKTTPQGWQAEILIPFKTLRFHNRREQVWGINFQRIIQRKNEEDLWSGYAYNEGITYLSSAGELHGLIDLRRGHQLEFFPYAKFGLQQQDGDEPSRDTLSKLGFNVKYGITPTLTADFTVNTDFAQVEADRARINLTRFSLYYPEKREFFLEGADIFRFGSFHSGLVFYSRRIGLSEDGREIPILAGARLTGRAGKYSIGVLDVHTADTEDARGANFFTARLQRDFWRQSKAGVIATQKVVPGTGYINRAFGADINLYFTNFLGDKNLAIDGYVAGSQTPGLDDDNLAWRIFIDYPNDLFDNYFYVSEVQENYNPEVGFVRRRNIRQTGGAFRYTPRPNIPGIRKLVFKPVELAYITDLEGRVESIDYELRPLGFMTQSGEFFEFNLQRTFERLNEDFNIFDEYVIPAGDYWFDHAEIQFETNPRRMFSGEFFLNWGDFYNGKRTVFDMESLMKVSAHLSASLNFRFNDISLPTGSFQTQEWGSRIGYAFNTRWDMRAFIQWNNEDREWNMNFRLHWIPALGSHFYLVYNHLWGTANRLMQSQHQVFIVKADYLFRW